MRIAKNYLNLINMTSQ